MKPKLTLIAVLLIVASCATESTQTPVAAAPQSAAVEKSKPKAAPKPKPYPLETCLVSFAVSAEHPSVTNPNPFLP